MSISREEGFEGNDADARVTEHLDAGDGAAEHEEASTDEQDLFKTMSACRRE